MQKIKEYVLNNKIKSIIAGIILIIIGYYTYKHFTDTSGQTTYVTGTVQRDTIVASITESGQVQANHQLDIKPKVSSEVVYVAKSAGSKVYAGDLIAQLDTSDAMKGVRDAEANLASAQLSLQKIQEPSDELSLLQAQNAVTKAKSDLEKAYDDGFNNISSAFIDLPSIVTGVDGVLHNSDVSTNVNQRNLDYYGDTASQMETPSNYGKALKLKTDAESAFVLAKKAYDKNFNDYKSTSRGASSDEINNLINETYDTSVKISDAVKSASNMIQYYQDLTTSLSRTPISKSNVHLSILSGYTNTINSSVSSLSNTKTTIVNDTTSIPEKVASLKKITDGANTLDIQSAQLSVKQRENALQDAKDNLADYYVRAPFSGTLASVNAKVGDPANSGTTVATLIADQQIATININEVDASKIKIGNKVTLSFDAIDGLTLTGKVATIDTLGTVTQGVVNYSATISFDSTDPRVKSGMSVSASIITATAFDVLSVPTSAIKNGTNGSYVLVFETPLEGTPASGTVGLPSVIAPKQQPVEIGLSGDSNTEIISGLTEGQQIVTKVIAPSNSTPATSTPSLLGAASGGNRSASTRGISGR